MTIRGLRQKVDQLAQYKRPVYTQQFAITKRSTDPTVGMDMIQIFRGFKDDFMGNWPTVPSWWTARLTGAASSAIVANSAHGGDLRMVTDVNAGDNVQIDFNNNKCVSCGTDVRSYMIWKTKLNAMASCKITMGLMRDLAGPPYLPGTDSITVDFDTAIPDVNWQLDCSAGGVTTSVNTGIAVDTVDHWFRLIFGARPYPPGVPLAIGWVELYIDDMLTPCATCTTNVTLYNLEPVFIVLTYGVTQADMSLDFVAISADAGRTGTP